MDKLKNSSALQWGLGGIGLLTLLFTLIHGSAGRTVIGLCLIIITAFEYLFKFQENKTFNPHLLMLLSPLLLLNYSSIADFRIRILCFIFFIYIFNAAYTIALRGRRPKPKGIKFSLVNAKPVTIWFTAFLIFAMFSTLIYMQGIHLSGDEPHYLMITQSITEDGDFDLKNNMDEKTYLNYIPIEVRFHGGEINGKYRSFHLPGMSFLLIPFYLLFKLVGGVIPASLYFRLAASVINAFFALVLFYILRMKFTGRDITGIWLLFLCIFPLAFHSVHLYPELPAAALMAAAYFTASSARRNIVLMGLFPALVPWFHVKYIPPLLVLTAAILYDLLKPFKPFRLNKEKIKRLLLFFLFPAISMILLIIYCKVLYNTYSPTNIFPKESYWTVPIGLRIKVFFAYFLDQRDGLLFYSPLFFTAFWALRKQLNGKILLLGIALSYTAFHAFTSVRGAYSPAGRPLMFISWILIVFVAHFYYNILKEHYMPFYRFSYKALAGFSFFTAIWLFYYPLFMYQPVFAATTERASGMNLFFGGSVIPLWKFFPSFLTSPENSHPATYIWIGLLAAFLAFYYMRPLKRVEVPIKPKLKEMTALLLFLAFSFLYCYYPHVHLLNQNKYTDKNVSFFNNSRNFRYVEDGEGKKGFRIKGGNNYDIFIDRKMAVKEKLTFRFTPTDVIDVTVRNGKRKLFQSGKQKISTFTIDVPSLKTLAVGNKWVSHLGIETQAAQIPRTDLFLWLEIK
jgi:hypothetical protein